MRQKLAGWLSAALERRHYELVPLLITRIEAAAASTEGWHRRSGDSLTTATFLQRSATALHDLLE